MTKSQHLFRMKKLLSIILTLVLAQTYAQGPQEIWGTTTRGGTGYGTIFKMDNAGNPMVVHPFSTKPSCQSVLTNFHEAVNGKLYNATTNGGAYDEGTLLELDPATGVLVTKVDFNKATTGAFPVGMVLAPNGKFYGVTRDLAFGGFGSVFEYDVTSNTLVKKVSFSGINGEGPNSDLLLASNGKLYGVTESGGDYQFGVLFEYDIASNSIIKKASFGDANTGKTPAKGLVENGNGKIYGMTTDGGLGTRGGTIYEYDIAGNTLVTKYKMTDAYSVDGLEFGNDGLLYGTTSTGTLQNEFGTLFKFDPANSTYTKIIGFDETNEEERGKGPEGTLKKASNGLLYGTNSIAGKYKGGVIYEFNPATSQFTKLFDFKDSVSGSHPATTFVQAKNGKLYACTKHGGSFATNGLVFEYDIVSKTYKKIQDFDGGSNGDIPYGLSQGENGKVYAVTSSGGTNNLGTLWECDPTTLPGTFIKKVNFSYSPTGFGPLFPPIQGPNGKLYGTMYKGKLNTAEMLGTIYEYDPALSTFTIRATFKSMPDGCFSPVSLTRTADNRIYGVTYDAGKTYSGVIFEFDPVSGSVKKKTDLKGPDKGMVITGPLIQAKNGKLYGVLIPGPGSGSVIHKGLLFEYDLSQDTIVPKVEFPSPDKWATSNGGGLVEAPNGKLYGTMITPAKTGILYEYDISTNVLNSLVEFNDSLKGSNPCGALLHSSNGKLYGMTSSGGTANRGVLFEYAYQTGTYTKKFDFTGPNGMKPHQYNTLIEVCKSFEFPGISIKDIDICVSSAILIQSGLSNPDYRFKWYKDKVLIPSATSKDLMIPSVKLSDAGIYHFVVNNGCRSMESDPFRLGVLPSTDPSCSVGIHEYQNKLPVELYPNPATEYIQLQFNHPSTKRITVEWMDIVGKLLQKNEYTLQSGESTLTLTTSFLPKGIYTVRITDTEQQLVENKKLIKQ